MVSPQITSSRFLLLEAEILLSILAIGGWGGFVSYLMKKHKASDLQHRVMNCLSQITVSCFTAFVLSIFAIEKALSFNMVVIAAALGGVFASTILRILGDKLSKFLERMGNK